MKLLSWTLAVLIAVIVLVCLKVFGREPRLLRGRLSPTLLRMVVLLLILVGDRAAAQTRPADDDDAVVDLTVAGRRLPPMPDPAPLAKTPPGQITHATVLAWAKLNGREGLPLLMALQQLRDPLNRPATIKRIAAFALEPKGFERRRLPLPPAFRAVLAAELAETPVEARDHARSLQNLINAADQLGADGCYSPAIVAYLWRTAAVPGVEDAPALAELYGRLESHARVADALRLAQAETGPVKYVPWMSKAARPEGDLPRIEVPGGFVDAAKRLYPTRPAGTWETDAAVNFKLLDAATLYRRGQKIPLAPGSFVRLRRLDVLVSAGARAEHRLLGALQLPPVLTSRNAAAALTADARSKLAEWAGAALLGDRDALKLLEMSLPMAVGPIDQALSDSNGVRSRGAPSLRMLRLLYDE